MAGRAGPPHHIWTLQGLPNTTRTGVVAGERAAITQHRCADMDYVGRSMTHADRGYYFTMGFPHGDTTTKSHAGQGRRLHRLRR